MSVLPECCYRVSVKALILNETRDKFLICKETDGHWELPGGGLEWGMTPQEDLSREIMEEMGLPVRSIAAQPAYFLTADRNTDSKIKIANVIYETTLEHYNFTPLDECVEIRFVDKHDIQALTVFDGVRKLAEMFRVENHTVSFEDRT